MPLGLINTEALLQKVNRKVLALSSFLQLLHLPSKWG